MRRCLAFVFLLVLGIACKNRKKAPDVSEIPVSLTIERFDQAFFSLDSNHIQDGMRQLNSQFPYFLGDFVVNILGTEPLSDTSLEAFRVCRSFLSSYMPVKDSITQPLKDLSGVQRDLKKSFQYLNYYFPSYRLPSQVLTYIGPFDAPGVALTSHALAIGLQLYAGKDFPFYKSSRGQELFPLYISRRFEPAYIVPNSLKVLTEDLYPDQSTGKPLIEEMVEKGKYWYLLDLLLPETEDSLKTGFTGKQLSWCKSNEGQIWNFLLQNDLYTIDPEIIKIYIGDGPYTQGMPEASPGNIGQWVGWQIVSKYASGHPERSPAEIMQMNARQLFDESKYKPK
jgi:hypothetical protein